MFEAIASIVINLSTQKLYALNSNGTVVLVSPVSTGRSNSPTPTGQFTVGSKYTRTDLVGNDYRINLPNVQCLRGSGLTPEMYCIHPTPEPGVPLGTPRSHGCVRVSESTAKWLFDRTVVGTPVTITY